MSRLSLPRKKMVLALGLVLLASGLVWAAMELAGALGLSAQDAGSNSADLEMLSLRTIQPPTGAATKSACDWAREEDLRRRLTETDQAYKGLCRSANKEVKQTGVVQRTTRDQILSAAKDFKSLCGQYAELWRDCGMDARAELAMVVGRARESSARYAALSVDMKQRGTNIEAYARNLSKTITMQKKMMEARRTYAIKAAVDKELDQAGRERVAALIPEVDRLMAKLLEQAEQAWKIQKEVQRQVGGGGDPEWGYPEISAALVDAYEGMKANAQELKKDVTALAGGEAPPALAGSYEWEPKKGCFFGATTKF